MNKAIENILKDDDIQDIISSRADDKKAVKEVIRLSSILIYYSDDKDILAIVYKLLKKVDVHSLENQKLFGEVYGIDSVDNAGLYDFYCFAVSYLCGKKVYRKGNIFNHSANWKGTVTNNFLSAFILLCEGEIDNAVDVINHLQRKQAEWEERFLKSQKNEVKEAYFLMGFYYLCAALKFVCLFKMNGDEGNVKDFKRMIKQAEKIFESEPNIISRITHISKRCFELMVKKEKR